jgi:L-ascorbate metabolism protein UlaG (beta-lactamase superfamily)
MKIVIMIFALASLSVACAQTKTAPLKPDEIAKPIATNGLTIRYIANEGVLIASAGKQILIDGLHREYRPAYLYPPPELQSVLETARPPYDKIDLLLVSHIHLDHFHAQSIGSYLRNNQKAIFVSSRQAVDEVANSFTYYEKVKSQIRPVTHELKKSVVFEQDGIKIKFLGLLHGGERWKEMQNLGHVIEIGGKKLLHIGDADMSVENFAPFDLANEKIDIAFIPYWFLSSAEGRALVKEQFAPKHIIAVHIPPADSEAVLNQLKKDMPEAVAFTKILEERSY